MKAWPAVYCGLAAVWLLLGLASGLRPFFVLFLLQILLLLAAYAINIWAAITFAFTQEISAERAVRGQAVRLTLTIHNEKPFPFPLMKIRVITPDPADTRELGLNLAAGSRQLFELDLPCPHRGEFDVGMTVIDFADLFGLFRLPFDMRLLPYYRTRRLMVLPRLIDLPGFGLPRGGSQARRAGSRMDEDPSEPYASVRAYRPGDPAKLIHWKLSLRHRQLLTRQFDRPDEPGAFLLLDLAQPGGNEAERLTAIDQVCEAALALFHALTARGWPLTVIGCGAASTVIQERLSGDFEHFRRWLATVTFQGDQPFHPFLAGSLAAPSAARAILPVTHQADSALLPLLLAAKAGSTPVYPLFVGAAGDNEPFAALLRQSGAFAWFCRSGDSLADVLGIRP